MFDPSGKYLISGSFDKTIKIWNMETRELIKTLEHQKGGINSVAISDDGKFIASGSGDKTVIMWDIETGEIQGSFFHDNFIFFFRKDNFYLPSYPKMGNVFEKEFQSGNVIEIKKRR